MRTFNVDEIDYWGINPECKSDPEYSLLIEYTNYNSMVGIQFNYLTLFLKIFAQRNSHPRQK